MSDHQTEIPNEIREALAEVLNLASAVAELQGDEAHYEALYALLDSVAEYFDIDHQRPIGHEEGPIETGFVDGSNVPPVQPSVEVRIRNTPDNDVPPAPDRDFG